MIVGRQNVENLNVIKQQMREVIECSQGIPDP